MIPGVRVGHVTRVWTPVRGEEEDLSGPVDGPRLLQ